MSEWTDFRRDVSYYVILKPDWCSLTFGTAPCTATGTPCFYTNPTCLDRVNYAKAERSIHLCSAHDCRRKGILPLLTKIEPQTTEIKPDEGLTVVGKIKLTFLERPPQSWSAPGKDLNPLVHNPETAGYFWANFDARNPNLEGRPVEVYVGRKDQVFAAYDLYFKGVITNAVMVEAGGYQIEAADNLTKLTAKLPLAQSDSNVLTATYNNGANMFVTDAEAYQDPTEYGGTCIVKLGESTFEYVSYTGRDYSDLDNQKLTGCQGGRYGTSPISHPVGTIVKNAVIVADPATVAGWGNVAGLPADACFLKVLCDLAQVPIADTAFLDLGVTLDGAIGSGDAVITVTNIAELADSGYLMIESECLSWSGKSGADLTGCVRGLFGTTAAAHANAEPVLVSQFSDEAGRWAAGLLFKNRYEEATALKDILNGLRADTDGRVWQGEDFKVHCKLAPVPFYRDTPMTLTEERDFAMKKRPARDKNAKARVTRVIVHYAPHAAGAGKSVKDYAGTYVHFTPGIEHPNYMNKKFEKTIYASWIYREVEARLVASHVLMRSQFGQPILKVALDLRRAMFLNVGDFVKATARKVVSIFGSPRADVTYEVTKKKRLTEALVEYGLLDYSGGVDGARYPVISPAAVNYDYDSASAEEQERYGWIGDADNKVGAAGVDGYLIS